MTSLKNIQFHKLTEEFPDGVIARSGSKNFNLENARKNTKIENDTSLNIGSIDQILTDMNRLVGTDRFNPSDYPIDILFTHSEQSTKMFLLRIQVDPDNYIILRDLGYTLDDNPGNANITPVSFQTFSLKTVGLIRRTEDGIMNPKEISVIARRLGLRLVSTDDNRILLNNEMRVKRMPTKSELNHLKDQIKKRLDILEM